MSFVLILLSPSPGARAWERRIGGLTTPLRLALAAQRAGADSIHLSVDLTEGHLTDGAMDGAMDAATESATEGAMKSATEGVDEVERALRDDRLRVPVRRETPPRDLPSVAVAADVVVHPGVLAALVDAVGDGRARVIGAGEARVVARCADTDSRASHGPPIPFIFAPAFGFPPMKVVTDADARRAQSVLLRSLRKTQDGWTSTLLNRYVSLAITRVLAHTPIHPNAVSVTILFIGVAGGVIAACGDYVSLVAGAALLQTQSMLDGCDGELARLTFRGSRLGEWLDTIGDDLSNYGFFAGASWGLYRTTRWTPYLVIGATIVGCGVITSALEYRYLLKIGSGDLLRYPLGVGGQGSPDEGTKTAMARLAAATQPLFKRDTFVLLTLVAAVLGVLGGMLVVFAIGGIAIVAAVIRAELRMARARRG